MVLGCGGGGWVWGWCGVVWFGVMGCGVMWCSVVWCDVVWCGAVWCGLECCGVVWCGVVARCCKVRCRQWGGVQSDWGRGHGMVCGEARCGVGCLVGRQVHLNVQLR